MLLDCKHHAGFKLLKIGLLWTRSRFELIYQEVSIAIQYMLVPTL